MSFRFRWLPGLARNLLGFRYFVIAGSLLFFAIIGIAFYLVYINSKVMHDQINNDFNQQQLILAHQAAAQIDAILRDLEIEMKSLKTLQPAFFGGISEKELRAVIERTRNKGLMEIGLMDPAGRILQVYDGSGSKKAPRGRIQKNCFWNNSGQMNLGSLEVESSGSGGVQVTSMFCTPIRLSSGAQGLLFARIDVPAW